MAFCTVAFWLALAGARNAEEEEEDEEDDDEDDGGEEEEEAPEMYPGITRARLAALPPLGPPPPLPLVPPPRPGAGWRATMSMTPWPYALTFAGPSPLMRPNAPRLRGMAATMASRTLLPKMQNAGCFLIFDCESRYAFSAALSALPPPPLPPPPPPPLPPPLPLSPSAAGITIRYEWVAGGEDEEDEAEKEEVAAEVGGAALPLRPPPPPPPYAACCAGAC